MATPKYAAYGVSKAGLPQLMKSLNAELKELKLLDRLSINCVSPGPSLLIRHFDKIFIFLCRVRLRASLPVSLLYLHISF